MQIKKTTTKKLIRSPKWILVNSQRNPINSAGWGEGGGRVTYPGLASHGGGGGSCTPSYFMLQKPG